ncbi:MAG: pilus (MSHA type) biogenesis protein MshL [Gammaproteobacteria bacterium]
MEKLVNSRTKTALRALAILMLLIGLSACGISKYFTPTEGHPAMRDMKNALNEGIEQNEALDRQEQAKRKLPTDVADAMLPGLSIAKPESSSGSHFNLSVKNVPARDFFLGLVKGTQYNVVVSPEVEGDITLNLTRVTVPEVLEVVHDLYGYRIKETDYGYQVLPPGLETKVYTINYLNVKRVGSSNTFVSSSSFSANNTNTNASTNGSGSSTSSSGTTSTLTSLANTSTTGTSGSSQSSSGASTSNASSAVDTTTESDFWKTLYTTLSTMIGTEGGRQVVVNPSSGTIIVRATDEQQDQIKHYIDTLQNTASREVLIEAKILQVTLAHGYQSGIDWKALTMEQNLGSSILQVENESLESELGSFSHAFTGTVTAAEYGDFEMVINLLSVQGNVQVLSSPRIATMNNQKAVIKVGQDEFFITDVSNTITGTSTTTDNTQDIELTPFFSGIALDVTPQISSLGDIILHIHPVVSKVRDQNKEFTIGGQEQDLPLALSQVREADSIVKAKNGQIVIIGGLMENDTQETKAATPFIEKIPLLGTLFRRTNQQSVKTELVILLKPVVVDKHTWTKELKKTRAQTKEQYDRGFSFGDDVNEFGNLGENWPKGSPDSKKAE